MVTQLPSPLLPLSFVVLLGLGCTEAPVERAPAESPSGDTMAARDLVLVPPFQGSYDDMWSALRTLDEVTQPVSSESAKQLLEMSENNGSASIDSVNPQPMIINLGTADDLSLWIAIYTDASLVKPETYSIVRPPREVLMDALYHEQVQGLSFNPYTRASRSEVFNFNVDKLYIAGLIGYLTTEDAEPGRRCDAANAAYAANKPFEALHHALRALDDQEEWGECELAKLWATWELDFPGSRAMAYEELEWFIGQGNDTDETRAMLSEFKSTSP